jgi:hypothetical protein
MTTKIKNEMKDLFITITIVLVSLCLFSCKSKKVIETTSTEIKISEQDEKRMYVEMSKEMCKCMESVLKLAENTEQRTAEETSDLLLEMQQESYKMEDCVDGLKPKYPSINFEGENNPKAEKALMENCPAYKKVMEKKKG